MGRATQRNLCHLIAAAACASAVAFVLPASTANSQSAPQGDSDSAKKDPAAAQRAYAAGTRAFEAGKMGEAVQQLTTALSTGGLPAPQMAKALYYRGVAYRKQGKPAQAISDLTTAVWLKGGLSDADRAQAIDNRQSAYREAGLGDTAPPVVTAPAAAPPSPPAPVVIATGPAPAPAPTQAPAAPTAAPASAPAWQAPAVTTTGVTAAAPAQSGAPQQLSDAVSGSYVTTSPAPDTSPAPAAPAPAAEEPAPAPSGSSTSGGSSIAGFFGNLFWPRRARRRFRRALRLATSAPADAAALRSSLRLGANHGVASGTRASRDRRSATARAGSHSCCCPRIAARAGSRSCLPPHRRPAAPAPLCPPPPASSAEPAPTSTSGSSVASFFGNLFSSGSATANGASAPAGEWTTGTVVASGHDAPPPTTAVQTASLAKETFAWSEPAPPGAAVYRLQVAAVRSRDQAERVIVGLKKEQGFRIGNVEPQIDETVIGSMGTFYRVRLGPYASATEPTQLCKSLKPHGYDCLVVTE